MPTTLTQDQLTRAIADMGRHYAAILFGAGASKTSLVPLAWEIVIDLCRDTYCEASGIPVINREYVRATDVRQWLQMQDWYAKAIERGESEYSAVFRQFKPTNDHQIRYIRTLVSKAKPSAAYDGLAHLVQDGVFDLALTTNFDPLLENRYKAIFPVEILNILKADHDYELATADSGRRHLAYLHGSLDGYSIANLDEHTRRLSTSAEDALARILNGYALVVAGYSGQDTSVMSLLLRLAKKHPSCFRRGVIYWCHLPGHQLSAGAHELLGMVSQGFTVEVFGFDHLITALCRRTGVGAQVFETAAPTAELSTSGHLLPDQAVLNITPAVGLPEQIYKFRTGLKSDDELNLYRDKYTYWQATVRDGHLWLLGEPEELPKPLRDACSLKPDPVSLKGMMLDETWNVFAHLANAGLHHWITDNLGLRAFGKKESRYFFSKLSDRDERPLKYRARHKRTQRLVVWLQFERGTESERTRYYAHEAFKARIIRFRGEPVLRISPTRLFTVAGADVWTGEKAGTSVAKQVKSIWNAEFDSLVRMWLDFFANGGTQFRVPFSGDARREDFCIRFVTQPYAARRVPP